jgi:serine/threonine protein kinase
MRRNHGDHEPLERLAGAIADGQDVDWKVELAKHGELKTTFEQLERLQAVANAHRRLTPEDQSFASPEVLHGAAPALPDPADPLRWGSLRVLAKLGHGTFGDVYRAYDPSLQREVALKLLRPGRLQQAGAAERFIEEARRLARVRHPNVLVVHGADENDDRAGFWTELLEGQTLEQRLQKDGPCGAQEATCIGIELCRALAALHAEGFVHRDVKLSNVMREHGGRIVLMDFGCVAVTGPGSDLEAWRTGTPYSMAPETLLEDAPPTASADLFALGVVLYRLVSGRYPFEAEGLQELELKLRMGTPTPLRNLRPDLPPGFVRAVERALQREPQQRYASIGEMERDLAGLIGPTSFTPDPLPVVRHGRWRLPVAIAASIVVLAASVAMLLKARQHPLEAEAALYRLGSGVEDRILPGGLVHDGDRLFLEIEGRASMYVYVLDEDESRNPVVLFPLGTEISNPLPAHARRRLPGNWHGVPHYWQVTSAGGEETILVLASRTPLRELEQEIDKFPRAHLPGDQPTYASLNPETLDRTLRGITNVVPGPEGQDANKPSTLSALARILSSPYAKAKGVWVWSIQVVNRAP